MMSGKSCGSLGRLKHAWLKRARLDDDLPPLAFKVAHTIFEYSSEAGEAWPAMSTLARDCRISERAARNFVRALESRGHVTITPGGGRSATNLYKMVLKPGTAVPSLGDNKPGTAVPSFRNKPGTGRSETRHGEVRNPAPACRQSSYEPLKELKDAASAPADAAFSVSDLPQKPPLKSTPKKIHSRQISKSENGAVSADPKTSLFRRAEEVLGSRKGGLVVKLLEAKDCNIALARAALETASTKANPTEYIGAMLRKSFNTIDSW
jgi:Helix-turn-helix domain